MECLGLLNGGSLAPFCFVFGCFIYLGWKKFECFVLFCLDWMLYSYARPQYMFNWPQLVALGNILCLDPSTLWMPCKAATYEAAVGVLIHVSPFVTTADYHTIPPLRWTSPKTTENEMIMSLDDGLFNYLSYTLGVFFLSTEKSIWYRRWC